MKSLDIRNLIESATSVEEVAAQVNQDVLPESSYVGNRSDRVVIQKTNSGKYLLVNAKTHVKVKTLFATEGAASKFAAQKGMKVVAKFEEKKKLVKESMSPVAFATKYSEDVELALECLKELNVILKNPKWAEGDGEVYEKACEDLLKSGFNYDSEVIEFCEQAQRKSKFTPDEVVEFALENERRNGTEPWFPLQGIERVTQFFRKYLTNL